MRGALYFFLNYHYNKNIIKIDNNLLLNNKIRVKLKFTISI